MPFTGKAVYSTNVFTEVAEDVSDTVSIISPHETPFLDLIGDADKEAESTIHQFMEGTLAPTRIYASAVTADNATSMGVTPAITSGQLMTGTLIENETSDEVFVITGTSNNTLTISRAFGGTSAATIALADVLTVLTQSALEGADVTEDVSVPRTRKSTIVQPFKKDIILSGTVEALTMAGGISSEMDYQTSSRTREILRDLERAVLRGVQSSVTLGSGSAYRTFAGLRNSITTNVTSYTAGSLTFTTLNNMFISAWDNGARDLDIIVCGKDAKVEIDGLLETQKRVVQGAGKVEQVVDLFESSFGNARVLLNRWMKAKDIIVASTKRVKVLPLKGRSFQRVPIAKTGDSEKAMIVGEYTVEVHNEEGMARSGAS